MSYGKGTKKLTAKLERLDSGLFRVAGIGMGVKGDIIDKWRVWAEATYAGEEAPTGDDVMEPAAGGEDAVTGACPNMTTGIVEGTPIMPVPAAPPAPPAARKGPPVLPPRKGPPVLPPRAPGPPPARSGPPALPPRSGPPTKPPVKTDIATLDAAARAIPGFVPELSSPPITVPSPVPPMKKPVDKGSGPIMAKFGTAAELATPVSAYRVSLHNGDLILVLSGTPFKLEGEKGKAFAFDIAELMKG